LQGNARDTASRPAHAMPRESTLGGRDVRTICLGKQVSKIFAAVHSETVDMLFTVRRVTQAKCPRDDAFRQLVECTENFAPWTAKRSRWQARRVLIDAGIGGGIASSFGQLLDNLAAADIYSGWHRCGPPDAPAP
jgi:hypothetical protein